MLGADNEKRGREEERGGEERGEEERGGEGRKQADVRG